ncbi:MAG: HEAT repeat domain-containing protein [Rhodopirellula sp. JB055]|uniref:HEAT repeat domain-containing protein n=1 Tax=Rhodopirellula sp. JB055 TaxID=3342846 RepID=UPI00370BF7F3
MSVSDPSAEIRINALQACANIPDEGDRLKDAVEHCLDASDLTVRLTAIQLLDRVELKPLRKVDAAIDYLEMRCQTPERRAPLNHRSMSPAIDVLKSHMGEANAALADRLEETGPMTLLHLQLGGLLDFDVVENEDRLTAQSKSGDQEVRREVVLLWSKYFASVAAKQSQPELSEKLKEINPKMLEYAERIIGRYDRDGSRSLDAKEWESMLMSPVAADHNHDGIVTIEEYALYMQNRSKK